MVPSSGQSWNLLAIQKSTVVVGAVAAVAALNITALLEKYGRTAALFKVISIVVTGAVPAVASLNMALI